MLLNSAVALVTGAASGLGRATAARMLKQNARVVLADLPKTEGSVKEMLASLGDAGQKGVFVGVDVLDEALVNKALDVAEKEHGGPVNVVVNCAGILHAQRTVTKKGPHPLEPFLKLLQVNVGGTFNVVRLAAARMMELPADKNGLRGVVINTSSIAAFEGRIGQVAYSASKGAVAGMTLPMARDLAKSGIRVNCIVPGMFATPILSDMPADTLKQLEDMVPCPSRLGDPDEYAKLVQSIVENAYLNGTTFRIDGALRFPP